MGTPFTPDVSLYDSTATIPFNDRLFAVRIPLLWEMS